jgi:hypothetical protein
VKAKINRPLLAAFFLIGSLSLSGTAQTALPASIERLTHSGNHSALYPSLSSDGSVVLYMLEELLEDGTTIKTIRILDTQTGEEQELYRSGDQNAPPPFEDSALVVGTKPPQISGDGQTALFSLSVAGSDVIPDHFLGSIKSDGTNFQIFSFPIQALEGKNVRSLEISSRDWERLANYAVNHVGNRVVCLLKGHLGPSRYGNPSGIIALDLITKEQRTLLSPVFEKNRWTWPSVPKNPLTGGGWCFGFSGNGETVLFGAQSSDEKIDYDLYTMVWNGGDPVKRTDFFDRWFSLGAISRGGQKAVFYYTGQKKDGIGTYSLDMLKNEVVPLLTDSGKRIEFYALSGNGRYLLYKQTYTGVIRDLSTGVDWMAFNEKTPGYAAGSIPMDFPRLPSFWCPQIMSDSGNKILLMGFPSGKSTPELYMLRLKLED